MEELNKKKYIKIGIIFLILAIIICIILNLDFSNNTEDDTNQDYIDTSEVESTTFKWEDITHAEIFGYEGNLTIDISYDSIPDFQSKLEAEYKKWEEKRLTLDPNLDANEIQANLNWLNELNDVYDASFCSVPADLNNHKEGDTIKITCDNETLRKLNYEFDDGFEITLKNLLKKQEEISETDDSIQTSENSSDSESTSGESSSSTVILETEKDNLYNVIGDTILVNVSNIDTVNLNPTKEEGQTLMVVVENKEDFEKVKQVALSQGKIDYIQLGLDVYEKESNFTEAEEWKGFSIVEE